MTYELHPLCTLFPRMAGAEFAALVEDIKANGQREPIVVHDGMILDGGNRFRACIEAGIEPQTMKFGGGNLVSYVLSVNLHRRHLSAGQQAAIVASAQDWANAQVRGANRHTIKTGNATGLDTVSDRSAISGASDKTQRNADKVAKANPDLAKAVGRGETTLSKAIEQITGKRPGAKPAPIIEPFYDKSDDEVAELSETIRTLAAENDALKDRLAVGVMAATEEEKTAAIDTIESLRAEVRGLDIALSAVMASRDSYQRENNELKRQLKMQRNQSDRARAA